MQNVASKCLCNISKFKLGLSGYDVTYFSLIMIIVLVFLLF